jgi:hypothetical protein
MLLTFFIDQNGDGTADASEAVGTATTDDQGFAHLTESLPLAPGQRVWRAAFAGSDPYIASEGIGYLSIDKEPTQLAYTGDSSGHCGTVTTLRAVLTDAGGNPVSGQAITLKVGSQSVPATTGPDGVALASLVLAQAVGTYDVQFAFAGTDNYEPASGSAPFAILNTPPKLTKGPAVTAGQRGAMTLVAGCTHPDPGQTVQAAIEWGDGTSQPVSVIQEGGKDYYGVSAPHTYAYDGIYTATITMTDSAGGTAEAKTQVTVASMPPTATLARFGFHGQPTELVLKFNEPLEASSASNLANYRLVPCGPRGKVAARARSIPLVAALYDEATRSVTLLCKTRLPLRNSYRLIVNGQAQTTGGVRDRASVLLDGNRDGRPGDSLDIRFNGKLLAGRARDWPIGRTTPTTTKTTTHATTAVARHAAAVDVLLAEGSLTLSNDQSTGPAKARSRK